MINLKRKSNFQHINKYNLQEIIQKLENSDIDTCKIILYDTSSFVQLGVLIKNALYFFEMPNNNITLIQETLIDKENLLNVLGSVLQAKEDSIEWRFKERKGFAIELYDSNNNTWY